MTTLDQANNEIKQLKARLIKRCRTHGISENFGQNEVRKLQDKYADSLCGVSPDREIWLSITAFDDWCMNYTGKD